MRKTRIIAFILVKFLLSISTQTVN